MFIFFSTTEDLSRRLEGLGSWEPDALFHAAAVSDFTFGGVWERGTDGSMTRVESAKFSTRGGNLFAELVPTPKIISRLREWFPKACIVGWKYELEGERESVIAKALKQIRDNGTNCCVANGRAYGRGFGLVSSDGKCADLSDPRTLFSELEKLASMTSAG